MMATMSSDLGDLLADNHYWKRREREVAGWRNASRPRQPFPPSTLITFIGKGAITAQEDPRTWPRSGGIRKTRMGDRRRLRLAGADRASQGNGINLAGPFLGGVSCWPRRSRSASRYDPLRPKRAGCLGLRILDAPPVQFVHRALASLRISLGGYKLRLKSRSEADAFEVAAQGKRSELFSREEYAAPHRHRGPFTLPVTKERSALYACLDRTFGSMACSTRDGWII